MQAASREERIVVGVRRGAHAEQPRALGAGNELVPRPRWDQRRIARADVARLAVDLEAAAAVR